jgi:hypothetical protein
MFLNRVRSKAPPDNIPQHPERLDRILGIVVIPGHAIVVEEREELVAILLKPLPAFQCRLALARSLEYPVVETFHGPAVPSEKVRLETTLVHRFNNRLEQFSKFFNDCFQSFVVRVAQNFVVQVPHQVNKTLLLAAR